MFNFNARSKQQKQFLRKFINNPCFLKNCFDKKELNLLNSVYDQQIEEQHNDIAVKIHQVRFATGILKDELSALIKEKFSHLLGDYVIDRISGMTSDTPNQIHTDTINVETDLPPHKNIMIPISVNGAFEQTKHWAACYTVYFNQVWLHRAGKAIFRAGYRPEASRSEMEVYDYKNLDNLAYTKFSLDFYEKYLSHLPYAHCKNLSPLSTFQWEPNSAIIFDRNRLHTSNNYIIKNVKWKRFICVFTNHATSGN